MLIIRSEIRIMRPVGYRLALTLAVISVAGWLAGLVSGCGNPSRAHAPGAATARKALEDSLVAWRDGAKPDRLAAATPPVHPVDFQWQAGQALANFQILADEPDAGDATKRFSVRLELRPVRGAKPAAGETTTHYVVLGRDPVWVYREDDYLRLLNMDNNPNPATSRKRR
jgi:hypothetical protein